jgi:hypothetical protein
VNRGAETTDSTHRREGRERQGAKGLVPTTSGAAAKRATRLPRRCRRKDHRLVRRHPRGHSFRCPPGVLRTRTGGRTIAAELRSQPYGTPLAAGSFARRLPAAAHFVPPRLQHHGPFLHASRSDPRRPARYARGMRGMPAIRGSLGASEAVPELRSRGVLRFLPEPARDQALSFDRSPDRRVLRARRGLALVLRRSDHAGSGTLTPPAPTAPVPARAGPRGAGGRAGDRALISSIVCNGKVP